jgi:metal-responsive CopG/Arc/MetJ family transcriptional regulator
MPEDVLAKVDGWAQTNVVETRSEAIRRLVELGLKNSRKR